MIPNMNRYRIHEFLMSDLIVEWFRMACTHIVIHLPGFDLILDCYSVITPSMEMSLSYGFRQVLGKFIFYIDFYIMVSPTVKWFRFLFTFGMEK